MKELKNIPILTIALGATAFFAVYKIMQRIGIVSTAQERAEETIVAMQEKKPDEANLWSPTAKLPAGAALLKNATADKFAKWIYSKAGVWYKNDDEEGIYQAFRNLKTQSQVVSIAQAYSRLYGKDLYYWLKDKLSKSEFAEVLKIVNSKPKYKVKK